MQETTTTTELAPVQVSETKKRITLSTFKAFIRKNSNRLFSKTTSRFDGMIDCVSAVKDDFSPVEADKVIRGAIWLVFGSRDYFRHFENESFIGIEVSNCCGCGILAVKK